eukprot:Skav229625  [mRNA]  locus=scaffold1753:171844:182397:- [translate_table: standard]
MTILPNRRKELTISWSLAGSPRVLKASALLSAEHFLGGNARQQMFVYPVPKFAADEMYRRREKPATDGYPSGVTEQSSANGPAEWLAQSGEAPAPAFGSIWNKNSWHWEEKNCIDLATAEVQKILEENPIWKHALELGWSVDMARAGVWIALTLGAAGLLANLALAFKVTVVNRGDEREVTVAVTHQKGQGKNRGVFGSQKGLQILG